MSPDARKHLLLSYAALIAVALINLGSPFVPVPNLVAAILGGVFITALYVGAVIAFALGIARAQLSITATALLLAFFVAVWAGIEYGVQPYVGNFLRLAGESGARPTTAQQFTLAFSSTIQTLGLIGGSTLAGALISRIIRFPNMLGPIGAAIALIDIWGVLFGGIVSQLLTHESTQPIAQRALAAGPQIGAAGPVRPDFDISVPAIGMGDFLFIGLLLCVLVRLQMNWKTPVWLIWVLVTGALLSIMLPVGVPPLPGLVFIGAGAVLPNLKYFTFTREEKFALLWAGLLVLVLTVALYFGFKAMLPGEPTIGIRSAVS